MTYDVVLVGAGAIARGPGQVHCGRRSNRAAAVAREFGVADSTHSVADALDGHRPDLVVVCTPPGYHLPVVEAALAAGAPGRPLVGVCNARRSTSPHLLARTARCGAPNWFPATLLRGHERWTMSSSLSVRHDYGHDLRVRAGDVELARYVYADDTPAVEAPKPYFHPVRTLSGAVVTAYRPHDHRWHKGVAMTLSQVSGQNFWGGPTFVRDRGYVQLDNVGRMRHDTFEHIDVGPDRLRFVQRLSWLASTGEAWLDERRTVAIHGVEPAQGHWILDFATCLTNVRAKPIYIGSPTTAGRELAGYGGLFWRGPRGWTGGEVHTAGCAGPDAMGTTSPWLAYVGRHDEHDGGGTLLVLTASTARNGRTAKHHWFVRNDPFPAVNPAPAFFDELTIEPGAALDLAYRLVIGDEMWSRDRIERVAKELAP